MQSIKKKAVFLDRDGVINQLIIRNGKAQAPYSLEEFALYPGVEEACRNLKDASYLLIVVTNQPDVSRGWTTIESVDLINARIRELLPIDDIEICFHTDVDQCHCRKPLPGMLLQAAERWGIDLGQSFMVGDRFGDISAGIKAGCTTFLVGAGDNQGQHPDPHFKVESLLEGSRIILSKSQI
ncbi:MAG: hypothetical protein RJB66_2562 [Pseudomonadota bacterium]|jgi:D-glycero-D-manno-heptose 1,7-bisphosphate phosphatase